MAGIGFEIKKIYKRNDLNDKVSGIMHTTFVSVGPTFITILMMIVIKELTSYFGMSISDQILINTSIVYAFIFSLVLTSGLSMVVSRYLADRIYAKDYQKIFPALVGSETVVLVGAVTTSALFFLQSPLPFLFKAAVSILYLELCILYQLMIFVSAIRAYKRISVGFLVGVLIAIVIVVAVMLFGILSITVVIGAVTVGFFSTLVVVFDAVAAEFDLTDDNYFEFLGYIKLYPELLLINLFYTLGLFGHNFIFWYFSPLGEVVGETFRVAPSYDTASFYGVLSIMPSNVVFVLKMETGFYEKYHKFIRTIGGRSRLKDLKRAKEEVQMSVHDELTFIIKFQLILSMLFILGVCKIWMDHINMSQMASDLTIIMVIGYLGVYIGYLATTILLYFDIKDWALKIQATFFISSIVLTIISVPLGQNYYGIGLAASGIIIMTMSLLVLWEELKHIDYRFFALQPIFSED